MCLNYFLFFFGFGSRFREYCNFVIRDFYDVFVGGWEVGGGDVGVAGFESVG